MWPEIFNWKALAEVLILAVGYFFLLSAIRGTRGAVILKGLVFVVVIAFIGAMWASDQLGFERIKQMLQLLLSGSVVALIVIFTPELRRTLMRIAQSRLLSPLFHGPSFRVINELVEVVDRLAKNRVGALIVLEREGGLGEYIEKGARLDAMLSAELLEALFHPGSALHDGAVIVQHDRVAAAGCQLPPTENPSISKSMGMRHRAAIGLSEETDAIVLVVSEETGRISLCVGGQMKGGLSRDALDRELRDLYTRDEKTGWKWGQTRRIVVDPKLVADASKGRVTPPGSPEASSAPAKSGGR